MDRFLQLKVFTAVAEEEGFNAAARRLNMSPPAVTRTVAALEDHLGVKLLNRTTRYVRVTDAGSTYLQDARRILNELESADEAAGGTNAEPRGQLVITAPVMFGNLFILPLTLEYLEKYPLTSIDTRFVDRMVNMLEEGIDIGIRIGELADSSMRAIRVGAIKQVLVASPEYIKEHGVPEKPADLKQHNLITSSAGDFTQDWQFKPGKQHTNIRVKSRLSVTTNDAAIHAAEEGFGISRVLSYQVADKVKQGHLKILLGDYQTDAKPIHIIHNEGRFVSTRVRSYIDFIAENLKSNSALQPVSADALAMNRN